MTELLRIQEPAPPPKVPPSWRAFMELGFRPLYLMGCLWAIAGVALWLCVPQALVAKMPGVVWHAHEMMWGFVATIAAGFLLTAASNWTGITTLQGRGLAVLCVPWVVARIGFLVPGADAAFAIAALCELGFFLGTAAALARAIVKSRNRRNYGVPLLALGLGAADALFLWAVWSGGDYTLLMDRLTAGLLCMAVVALLIARRVIPFFASRAVAGLEIPMHTRSGQWQIAAGVLAIACLLAGWGAGQALFLAAAGVLALWQVAAWKPWAVRRVPLLWILYAGYAALGAGLLVAAAHAMGWITRTAWPAHAIGAGGFAILIIGMVTRTALGHLGRPLRTDRSMVAAYVLVMLAAILRLIALAPTDATFMLILQHAAATAWIVAFGLYLWRFVPMMIRPRPDRPPPQPMPVRMGMKLSKE